MRRHYDAEDWDRDALLRGMRTYRDANDDSLPMDRTHSTVPRSDVGLVCRDCGGSFTISDEERRTFADLGHLHPPSRCSTCRAARKQRQAESGTRAVAPGFRELKQTRTTVVCSSCGKSAVVPFAARAGRRVYCSACFQQRRFEADT